MRRIFWIGFRKIPEYKISWNPSIGTGVVPCGQTDLTKLIVAFLYCANAPKNVFRTSQRTHCLLQRPVSDCCWGSHWVRYLVSDYVIKCKAVPLQAWGGPDGSRKLRFPDFLTTAQDGGKVVSLTHRPHLPPGNTPGTHFCWRLSRPQGHSAIGRIIS
jgi:hypothetical protein